jgi:GAF domain-containing protein
MIIARIVALLDGWGRPAHAPFGEITHVTHSAPQGVAGSAYAARALWSLRGAIHLSPTKGTMDPARSQADGGRLSDPERLAVVREVLREGGPLPSDAPLERLAHLAARLTTAPATLVALVDVERVVVEAAHGERDVLRTGMGAFTSSLCTHVVRADAPLVIGDVRVDPRVRDTAPVGEHGVAAFAGVPVRVGRQPVGAFCALDHAAHAWSAADVAALEDLAAAAAAGFT